MPDPASQLFPPEVHVVTTTETVEAEWIHPLEAAHVERAAPKRRNEFFAGRHCAHQALAQLGIHGFALLPDANRVPRWPDHVVGTITHCARYAGAAVAEAARFQGVGLDAEPIGGVRGGILDRICSAAERAKIVELQQQLEVDWATLFFSAKESFYKAYFPLTRRFLGFHDVEVRFDVGQRAFGVRFLDPALPLAERATAFRGCFAQDAERVYTGVALARSAD